MTVDPRNNCKSNFCKVILTALLLILLPVILAGCSAGADEDAGNDDLTANHVTGIMPLDYATQFHVDYLDDAVKLVSIEDGLKYLLVPESADAGAGTSDQADTNDPEDGETDVPDWLTDEFIGDAAVIRTPVTNMYMAASSGMDLINAIDGIDAVSMTSTSAKNWAIPEIRELVDSGRILYIGKYSAPDYEALLEGDADIAVESTMIYHSPQIKEAIEELEIPVLVERSSYENDPLGRLEWIKLYGLLLGREDEADEYFDRAVGKVGSIDTEAVTEPPVTAFFSVNSNGSAVVRKPGDYVTKMIEMAGGRYALDGIEPEDENALSTMNMQMEAFYDKAVDADILIYNSAIESDLSTIEDLTSLSDRFRDFKAVGSGDVWCTNKSMFQKTTGAADMIVELNRIFAGAEDDEGFEYFHKLKQSQPQS